MEHIEYAGIHSGDSACAIPPISIPAAYVDTISNYTRRIALELGVVGLMNIQYAIADGKVYVLEANPRASRTVPLVSKVCNIQMARIATQLMLGRKLADLNLKHGKIPHFGVKEAVFPFNMLPEVDPVLGPEMRSTGEVLGLASTFGEAFFKAQEATQMPLPRQGTVLITVARRDRPGLCEVARGFAELGFKILATEGTAAWLARHGIPSQAVNKMHEGRPHIVDFIKNREIDLIVNTPAGKESELDDSYIRKNAIKYKVHYITTLAGAMAAAKGIAACRESGSETVQSLQAYHASIQ
jgi:carbamoyl-phosphate synthase large subunit